MLGCCGSDYVPFLRTVIYMLNIPAMVFTHIESCMVGIIKDPDALVIEAHQILIASIRAYSTNWY